MTNQDFIDTLKVLLIIGLIVLVCFIIFKIIKRCLKNKDDTITAYTGGLGSGKTLLSIDKALTLYYKNLRKYKRRIRLNKIRAFVHLPLKEVDDHEPILLSNIPFVVYKRSKLFNKDEVLCYQLKKEHLLLQEHIPQLSVVCIDELGAFASQFKFKDTNIIEVFDEFVRFFRHYTKGGYIVCNDQCSENINLVIRRRVLGVHNLSNCYVSPIFGLTFWYERIIYISEEIKSVDIKQNEQESDHQDNMNFKWRFVRSYKRYDTYCYSDRYLSVPYKELTLFQTLKVFKLLKCPSDKEYKYIAKTSNIRKEE